MCHRKVIKVGDSVAVTLPPTFGFVVGSYVDISKVGSGGSLLITKLQEVGSANV